MKIGIDARMYGDTGIGRYTSNLIENLEELDQNNQYIIFLSKEGDRLYTPRNNNFKKWVVDVPLFSMEEQTQLLKEFYRAHLDLLHVPNFNIPVLYPGKLVVTIHDLIMQKTYAGSPTKKLAAQFVAQAAAKKAKKIIVPTESVMNDVLNNLKFAKQKKIAITPEGIDKDLISYKPTSDGELKNRLNEMRITGQYFLYVGNSYDHKNLKQLVISYDEWLKRTGKKTQLVIAGKVDGFAERLAAFSHGLRLDNLVVFAAKYTDNFYVPEKDLAYLYKGAHAYILPSKEEGFSITPLEAQAFNIPVLLSDIPTHKEVFGDSVLYFDPESGIELTEKMQQIDTDENLRKSLVQKGSENIKKYSWRDMAQKTLEVYNA